MANAIEANMHRRHARKSKQELPKLWLITDERMGGALIPSLLDLPKGSGVVFRHYGLPPEERRALFESVRRLAKARRLILSLAGCPRLARAWRADGSHGRHHGALTVPVHTAPECVAAERCGGSLLFLSPVFATKSHPGARTFGRVKFGALTLGRKKPVIALGGMTKQRAETLKVFGIYGWAAIDGLSIDTAKQD
jgi:thiamine-phosphate pyrophosphorylase